MKNSLISLCVVGISIGFHLLFSKALGNSVILFHYTLIFVLAWLASKGWQAQKRLTEASRSLAELEAFSYTLTHDLRSPLGGISGYSRLLLTEYSDRIDTEGQEYIRRISSASHRMSEFIDAFLEMFRHSHAEPRFEVVDLGELAGRAIENLKACEPDRQVDVRIHGDLFVHGDPRLLASAIENLVSNSWKFTSGLDTAQIELGKLSSGKRQVFFVRDNGVGFDMTHSNKLFREFQRLHEPNQFKGFGVGLASARRVIDRHGGEIWAEGELGKGATFYFTLDEAPGPKIETGELNGANGEQTL